MLKSDAVFVEIKVIQRKNGGKSLVTPAGIQGPRKTLKEKEVLTNRVSKIRVIKSSKIKTMRSKQRFQVLKLQIKLKWLKIQYQG